MVGGVRLSDDLSCFAFLSGRRERFPLNFLGWLKYKAASALMRLLRRKDMFGKVRKTRSDCTVGTYEKKHDLPTGTLRNSDGRKARKDKTLKSLRKETGSDYR